VDDQPGPVRPPCVEGGRDGRRGVHDDEVSRCEQAGQVAEAVVGEAGGRADQQAHLVAGQPALLGRLGGLELGGQREVERRLGRRRHAHAGTAISSLAR
jgi:hypothetical protein